jgi:hypothetical protein
MEWRKRPAGVGQPPFDTLKRDPKTISVSLYVSGFATKKNIKAL